MTPRASAEELSGKGGQRKKRPKNSKNYRKVAILSFFQGEGATEKRPKNSTIKPLSTLSAPCMKIQGGHSPLPPAANAHE